LTAGFAALPRSPELLIKELRTLIVLVYFIEKSPINLKDPGNDTVPENVMFSFEVTVAVTDRGDSFSPAPISL